MKMRKKILLPLALFIGILINSPRTSAAENLNTSLQLIKAGVETSTFSEVPVVGNILPVIPLEKNLLEVRNINSYSKVFEDVKSIFNAKENLSNVKLNISLDNRVIDDISKNQANLGYLFYDINDDGIDELILPMKKEGSNRFFVAYYLNNKEPKLLEQSYAAGNGEKIGYTNAFLIAKSGKIYAATTSPITGGGELRVLHLEKDELVLDKKIAIIMGRLQGREEVEPDIELDSLGVKAFNF